MTAVGRINDTKITGNKNFELSSLKFHGKCDSAIVVNAASSVLINVREPV